MARNTLVTLVPFYIALCTTNNTREPKPHIYHYIDKYASSDGISNVSGWQSNRVTISVQFTLTTHDKSQIDKFVIVCIDAQLKLKFYIYNTWGWVGVCPKLNCSVCSFPFSENIYSNAKYQSVAILVQFWLTTDGRRAL